MKLEVLISCMHQKDASIIQKTNIQSDVLVINQCDEDKIEEFDFLNKKGEVCHARIIYTTERGLSKSRNMAIRNAKGDICLICDDDEVLDSDYSEKIISEFAKSTYSDIITFIIDSPWKTYSLEQYEIGYLKALQVVSWQIAFRCSSVIDNNIWFNEKMGAGTANGAGEENKFLYDCLRSSMKILYVPIHIGSLLESNSQWFTGYNESYFINRGWTNKMILGVFFACLYDIYYSIFKYKMYHHEIGFLKSLYCQLLGTFQKR